MTEGAAGSPDAARRRIEDGEQERGARTEPRRGGTAFVFVYFLSICGRKSGPASRMSVRGCTLRKRARFGRRLSVVHSHLTSWQLSYDDFLLKGFLTKSPGILHTIFSTFLVLGLERPCFDRLFHKSFVHFCFQELERLF